MRGVILTLLVAGMVPLALFNSAGAILVWVWAGTLDLSGHLYPPFKDLPFQKLFALIALMMLIGAGKERGKRFYLDLPLTLMLAFLIVGFLAQLFSPFQAAFASAPPGAPPAGWDLFNKLWKEILLGLLIGWTMGTRERVWALVIAIALGRAVTGTWEGALFLITGGGHKVDPEAGLGDNNYIALLVAMSLPLLLYIMQQSPARLVRLATTAVFALSILCVVATRSRGGFIALLLLAGWASLFSKRRFRTMLVGAVAVALAAAVVPSTWVERMQTIKHAERDESLQERVIAWKVSTLIAMNHPMLGGGFHAVQQTPVWDRYRPYTPKVNILGIGDPESKKVYAAHSIYFELLGDTGFLGLGTFLAMVASAFFCAYRIIALTRHRADLRWAADLARMVRLSLVMLMVSGAALSISYVDINFDLIALLSVTRRQINVTLREETNERQRERRQTLLPIAAQPARSTI